MNADPYARIAELAKTAPPIFWTPRRNGHWVAVSHAAVFNIARDPDSFSNSYMPQEEVLETLAIRANGGKAYPLPVPIMIDPPRLSTYRKPLQKAFSPKTINGLSENIRLLARQLVASVRDNGSCEFIQAVAVPLPVGVFLAMFGLPLDRQGEYRTLVQEHLEAPEYDSEKAGLKRQRLADAMNGALLERQRNPRDDLISQLWATEIDGRPITLPQMEDFAVLLFVAGLDTVLNGIGHGVRYFAENVELQERLRKDPSLIPEAVEELMRRFGFVIPPPRRVINDMTYQGVEFRRGDIVNLFLGTANLDPNEFENPEVFDLDRNNKTHLLFNAGPHRCLGSHLARLEMRICYEELLSALPTFRLDPDKSPTFHSGHVIGVDSLHLKW
jgi:cytochrome P450